MTQRDAPAATARRRGRVDAFGMRPVVVPILILVAVLAVAMLRG